MASRKELRRNNLKAGVFVTVTLALLLGVVVALSGAVESLFNEFDRYAVTFPVEQGVGSISSGSDVRLGGMSFGSVTAVDLDPEDPLRRIRIDFDIDARVELFDDAILLVKSQLIGAESWLEIPSVGTTAAGPPAGGVIAGTSTPGLLSTLLGAQNAARADEIVRNTEQFSGFLADARGEYEQRFVPTLDDLRTMAGDAREVVADVNDVRWPRWASTVDDVMTWAGEATTRVDETVAEGRQLLVSARAVVDDNRPQIDTIVDNVDLASADAAVVTERVRTETVDKVHVVLDGGRDALERASETLARVQADYEGWAQRFGELMANATLASQELKFATIEVRRSPWKLLHRPTTEELENELLYEAARSFALATADLRATSETVDRILRSHGGALGDRQDAIERIGRDLDRSLENYTRAQEELLGVILEERD